MIRMNTSATYRVFQCQCAVYRTNISATYRVLPCYIRHLAGYRM